MDVSPEYLQSFIGRPAEELPTPAFVLSKPVLERNTQKMLDDVEDAGIRFRPHVKTLKSAEVTRLMLGGVHKGVVASTLREIRGLLPLAQEGLLEEILYGLPIRPGALPELLKYSESVKILLMVDHISQLSILESFNAANSVTTPWSIFIKIDMGTHRAGMALSSPALKPLIAGAEASPAVSVHGFYCHAGHSYGTRSPDAAAQILHDEVHAAAEGAKLLAHRSADDPVVVSFGSTPTAHVVRALRTTLPPHMRLELHAGNYPANDLQQEGTGSVGDADQAVRVLAEVCSVYAERDEALVNAGVVALARESGPLPGFGRVVGKEGWVVGRLSQEHGILVRAGGEKDGEGWEKRKVEEEFEVGHKVWLRVQHACITAAAHYYYFVVDEQDVVREIWYPWKGW